MIEWHQIKIDRPPENVFLLFSVCGPNGVISRVEEGIFRNPILPCLWATHWSYFEYKFVPGHECTCLFPKN